MKSKLTLFKNKKSGQQIMKKDGSLVEFDGKPVLHCILNGKINLPEGLPAGEYEVSVYENTGKESGLKYYAGNIKPAWKKPEENQPETKTLEQAVEMVEDLDDDIPF